MDRRKFVSTAGIMAGTVVATQVLGEDAHKHHKSMKKVEKREISKVVEKLLTTTSDCIDTGRLCTSHCFRVVKTGDLSMVDCQESVLNMLKIVDTLHAIVSYGTASKKNLAALTTTCRDFCEACKKECDKHRDHHEECRQCADACAQCITACNDFLKA